MDKEMKKEGENSSNKSKELKESESNYHSLIELAVDGILIGSHEGIVLQANESACKIFGISKKEIIGKHVSRLPFTKKTLIDHPFRFDLLKKGKIVITERDILHSNGSIIIVEMKTKMMPDGTYQSIYRDITERKKVEEGAINSEKRYKSLFSNMLGGFAFHKVITNKFGKPVDYEFLDVNSSFEAIVGLKKKDLIGKNVRSVLPGIEKDPADWIGKYGHVALTGKSIKFENYAVALKKWFSVSAYSPEKGYFVTLFEDITDIKHAEGELRKSEERLSTITKNNPDHILLQDKNLLYEFVLNPQLGLTEKDMIGKTDYDFLPKEEAENLTKLKNEVLKTGKSKHLTVPLLNRKGEKEYFDGVYLARRGEDNKINGIIGYFRNITERKKFEEELKKAKENIEKTVAERTIELQKQTTFLGSILENIPDMVFVKNARDLRFELFNRAGEDLLGKKRKDLIGKNDYDFFPKKQADFFTQKDGDVLKNKILLDIPEEQIKTSRGERKLHTKKIPILDKQGKPIYLLGISEDITERKKAEEELKKRNSELEDRANELERFNQVAIDRELTMVKLKKKIKQLESEKKS